MLIRVVENESGLERVYTGENPNLKQTSHWRTKYFRNYHEGITIGNNQNAVLNSNLDLKSQEKILRSKLESFISR
jgi:hypothetical protein